MVDSKKRSNLQFCGSVLAIHPHWNAHFVMPLLELSFGAQTMHCLFSSVRQTLFKISQHHVLPLDRYSHLYRWLHTGRKAM